jgi:fructose-1,6-bisphosphatase/inositol monophosphatase family enzyme
MVEYNLKIWDLSATQALIKGAGGSYSELGGDEPDSGPRLYHAAFGKPGAVARITREIQK